MRTRNAFLVVAAMLAAFTFSTPPIAHADTFGSGSNAFTIDFVSVGNAGNATGPFGRGSVRYEYRISTYEITQDAITKATAGGLSNVTAGAWTGNQPAADISWYEAAAFVNWLNTNKGKQEAYRMTFTTNWGIATWQSTNMWVEGGDNPTRHKNAFYFLATFSEWYKAGYYNPSGSNYFLYPTASDTEPTPVASGTNAGTAVYNSFTSVPAVVHSAGGLSPYGTMGQGGNVSEWSETAQFEGGSSRRFLGGYWESSASQLQGRSTYFGPNTKDSRIGFRVASVALKASDLPQIVSASNGSSGFSMTWTPPSNVNVQRSFDLNEGAWITILSNFVGTNYVDEATPAGRAFYRLTLP